MRTAGSAGQAYLCPISQVQKPGRHGHDVDEAEPGSARRPAEELVALDVHVCVERREGLVSVLFLFACGLSAPHLLRGRFLALTFPSSWYRLQRKAALFEIEAGGGRVGGHTRIPHERGIHVDACSHCQSTRRDVSFAYSVLLAPAILARVGRMVAVFAASLEFGVLRETSE